MKSFVSPLSISSWICSTKILTKFSRTGFRGEIKQGYTSPARIFVQSEKVQHSWLTVEPDPYLKILASEELMAHKWLSRTAIVCYISCFVLLFLSGGIEAKLIVQNMNGTQTEIESTQIIYAGNPSLPSADLLTLGVSIDINQTNGLIYVITSNLPVEKVVLRAQNNGAAAVVVISPLYYIAGYLRYRLNEQQVAASITVPLYEVPVLDGKTLWTLVTNNQVVNMTITPQDTENQWIPVMNSGGPIAATVLLCAFALTNMGLAIWKITVFVRYYGGFRTSIALYVLSIELIANFIRFIGCLDNVQAFQLYPEWAVQTLNELSMPFALSSYMLFTLYWHEMMTNATVIVHPFITKMKIPFFVASAALICLQIIRSVIRNVSNIEFSLVTSIIYLIVIVTEFAFYGVTGGKLLKRLHHSKHMGRTVNLRKSTIRIMVSMCFAILFVILASLFIARVPYRPIPFVVIWTALTVMLNAASLMNIMAFELPSKHSSSSSTNNSTTGTNTATN